MTTMTAPPRKREPNRWVRSITEAWFMANHAWELEAEAFSNGYGTELEEFAQIKPRPRLKDFMVHMSPKEAAR